MTEARCVFIPPNVEVGDGTAVIGDDTFKRFNSRCEPAVRLGRGCTLDLVQLAMGAQARLEVGDHSYLTSAVLLVEQKIRIGSYVVIGWNATIADSDFHPLDPARRVADAVACSPLGRGRPRPPMACSPVTIGDDVWIGPNVTIFKGVRVGNGAFIEPGSVVTTDVAPGSRVLGNPARPVGEPSTWS